LRHGRQYNTWVGNAYCESCTRLWKRDLCTDGSTWHEQFCSDWGGDYANVLAQNCLGWTDNTVCPSGPNGVCIGYAALNLFPERGSYCVNGGTNSGVPSNQPTNYVTSCTGNPCDFQARRA